MNYRPKGISLMLIIAMGISSCSSSADVSKQTLATIPLQISDESSAISSMVTEDISDETVNQLSIEIDEETHTFSGVLEGYEDSVHIEGIILTEEYPSTLNSYRVINSEVINSPESDELRLYWINSLQILGNELSHEQQESVINSFERIDVSDTDIDELIEDLFPDTCFGNYILSKDYPVYNPNGYQIQNFDTSEFEYIEDAGFTIYTIRESINGIPLGLSYDNGPSVETLGYPMVTTFFHNEMHFDGENFYEVPRVSNFYDSFLEVELQDKPVLSLEDAIDSIEPLILELSSDYHMEGNKYIYAAELIYAGVIENETSDMVLYPYWAFYCHCEMMNGGKECGESMPIYVNAITGEARMP